MILDANQAILQRGQQIFYLSTSCVFFLFRVQLQITYEYNFTFMFTPHSFFQEKNIVCLVQIHSTRLLICLWFAVCPPLRPRPTGRDAKRWGGVDIFIAQFPGSSVD